MFFFLTGLRYVHNLLILERHLFTLKQKKNTEGWFDQCIAHYSLENPTGSTIYKMREGSVRPFFVYKTYFDILIGKNLNGKIKTKINNFFKKGKNLHRKKLYYYNFGNKIHILFQKKYTYFL